MQDQTHTPARHAIERVRYDLVRRKLTVHSTELLTPGMRRIQFSSPELTGFQSRSPDDHIRMFFLDKDGNPLPRDYTPRAFDADNNILTIDFALHGHGPAATWAANAQVGDTLEIGGPRGSQIVPDDFDWYLLVADESALPALARRVETLRDNVPVTTVVAIANAAEKQSLTTRAALTQHWITRGEPSPSDAATLLDIVRDLPLPAGEGYIWIAGEADIVKQLRAYFVEERQHPSDWIKAPAYWHRAKTADETRDH